MSCSSEPTLFQMLYPVAYTAVIPLNFGITMHVTKTTFNVFMLKNRSNTVTIPGILLTLQSNQVKRSRRERTNEFIHGKMISFVDSTIHS